MQIDREGLTPEQIAEIMDAHRWDTREGRIAAGQAIAQRAAEAERARCAAMARAFKDHGYDYTGDLELHEAIASGFDSGAQGEQA